MLRLIGLLSTLVLLSVAPATAAPVVLPLTGPPLSDPVFTGDGSVAWVADRSDHVAVLRADPAGTVTEIASLPPLSVQRGERVPYVLDASPEALVVERRIEHCDTPCRYPDAYYTTVDQQFAGPPGGPLPLIADCGSPGARSCLTHDRCDLPGSARVAGPVVAVVVPCPDGDKAADRIELRTADDSAPTTVFDPTDGSLWDFTDGLILTSPRTPYATPLTVRLRRWPSGELVTQHVFPADEHDSGFAIADHDAIVYSGHAINSGIDHLWLLAPGAAPRDLGPTGEGNLVAVAGDQALLSYGRIVSLVDGSIRRVDLVAPRSEPAFDGAQVAYRSQRCQVESIVVQDALGPAPAELRQPCRTPAVIDLHRASTTATLTLRCPDDPVQGCIGSARVLLTRGRGASHRRFYLLQPGQQAEVRLPLSRQAQRWLRAHPRPPARVVLRPADSGYPATGRGPAQTSRRTLAP
jgi:hypothetical protein